MEQNGIVSAPQVRDFSAVYLRWRESFHGSKEAFIEFLSTPSAMRSEFLAGLNNNIEFQGSVAMNNFAM